MKKNFLAGILSLALAAGSLSGCAISTTSEPESSAAGAGGSGQEGAGQESAAPAQEQKEAVDVSGREEITLWFFGAEPYAQEALKRSLADKYNASQDKYSLSIEFRASVDSDMSTALAANQGPDIVYGSGPSFVMPLVEAGKLAPMDEYSKQYGWEDRLMTPIYESGLVHGTLYSVTNGVNTLGVFYNKKVLADNGWEVPKTLEELETIMDEAMAKGMYACVGGNKGWKPVNENYASLALTHIAGPQAVYQCLKGEQPWNNPDMTAAIEMTKEWWDKGYLAGDDYVNLNYSESLQLLADERSPFFIGPSIGFQWAASFFTGDIEENLGFIPFPATETVPNTTYTLGSACTLSINANVVQEHKDEAAKIIDMILTPEFMQEMTTAWPGYWGTPLKDLSSVDTSGMGYLSKTYTDVVNDIAEAVNSGNFGYFDYTFFPPATQQNIVNIEDVWYDTISVSDYLDKIDKDFKEEAEKDLVPPIPVPGAN